MIQSKLGASSLLVAAALASGGCVAGGFAAVGPVLSVVQAVTDRTVERTISADLPTSIAITEEALTRMAIPIQSSAAVDEAWLIRGANQGLTVEARLSSATERLTRIVLRVEAGRVTADKQTSEEIHNQIARTLTERRTPSAGALSGHNEAIAALELQVRSLRMELERQRRPVSSPAPPTSASPFSVNPNGVITVPASYGFATPAESRPVRDVQATSPAHPAPTVTKPATAPSFDTRTTPLESASTLTAVPALGSRD